MDPREVYLRYVRAGLAGDPDAQAGVFAEDGVLESPLATGSYPPRVEGRAAIREFIAGLQAQADRPAVDTGASRYALHVSAEDDDTDVVVSELDVTFVGGGTMSLVQIFRIRAGEVVLMRDYFRA
jgi:uncharacterized protein